MNCSADAGRAVSTNRAARNQLQRWLRMLGLLKWSIVDSSIYRLHDHNIADTVLYLEERGTSGVKP
jgi:hypothetical protein